MVVCDSSQVDRSRLVSQVREAADQTAGYG